MQQILGFNRYLMTLSRKVTVSNLHLEKGKVVGKAFSGPLDRDTTQDAHGLRTTEVGLGAVRCTAALPVSLTQSCFADLFFFHVICWFLFSLFPPPVLFLFTKLVFSQVNSLLLFTDLIPVSVEWLP